MPHLLKPPEAVATAQARWPRAGCPASELTSQAHADGAHAKSQLVRDSGQCAEPDERPPNVVPVAWRAAPGVAAQIILFSAVQAAAARGGEEANNGGSARLAQDGGRSRRVR